MKSVLRSLDVLELISEHQPITVGELTRLLDLPKTTVQRTLVTLFEAGWLMQSGDAVTSWEISPRILSIRPIALRDGGLIEAARGAMTTLRDRTDETSHLVLPNGTEGVILVERIDCDQAVRAYSPLGYRSPYTTTATGKAILAHLPSRRVDEILAAPGVPAAGSSAELHEELQRIQAVGYAVNVREHRPGVCAVAAPVLDARGRPVAAVCISIPETRFDDASIDDWASATITAARSISERI